MSRPVRRQDLYVPYRRRGDRVNDPKSPALVSEVISPVDDVGRLLDRALYCVVLDVRKRLVGETDLRRWLVPEFQPQDLGAGRNEPTFHGWSLDLETGEKTNRKCASFECFSPVWSATLGSGATDDPCRRINGDRAGLRSLGVDRRGGPVRGRTGYSGRGYCNIRGRLEPLSNSISREVIPAIVGRVELLVQRKIPQIRLHACDVS